MMPKSRELPPTPRINGFGSMPHQKMDNLFRAVIAVPTTEIDRREKEWKRAREAEESGGAIARSLSTACIGLRVTKGITTTHIEQLRTSFTFFLG